MQKLFSTNKSLGGLVGVDKSTLIDAVASTLREATVWESENQLLIAAEAVVRQTLAAADSRLRAVCGDELPGIWRTANLQQLTDVPTT
ncbi:hypothetical protein [Pararhodobacter sp.]|uniref:hypothetical protein n=1 Tax=Pararhodobacter sp. TaxID=2127056 RepID=UPI002FDC9A69